MMTDVGKRVREAREAKGWSQEKLAEEAGTSQTTVDKIERNQTKKSRFLMPIARKLGINFDELDPDYLSVGGVSAFIHASGAEFASDDKNELPVYVAFQQPDGSSQISIHPSGFMERYRELRYSENAYAIYVSTFDLSPEFEPGDIAIVDPGSANIIGSTCIFFSTHNKSVIFRRLVGFDEDNWTLAKWHPERTEELRSRNEWAGCHRIVIRKLRS